VCAHGTGTPLNDSTETKALKMALGDHAYRIPASSVKSMIGHLLGAAGALSAVAAVKTLETGCIAPTINQFTADPDCDLDYVPWKPRKAAVRNVLVNGFGFGGQNSVAVFKRWEGD
jgi:3-oxoacyl-[acyl-carrier-protein] synthase II